MFQKEQIQIKLTWLFYMTIKKHNIYPYKCLKFINQKHVKILDLCDECHYTQLHLTQAATVIVFT